MVVVSYSGREINAKIVYYGPGLSGKTTNLEKIYDSVPETNRGRMVSMKTQTDRTLFFDLLPLDLGDLQGMKTRLLLYTVPGQVYYNATRKLVLKGVDAVVFVADSAADKMVENRESFANLEMNLKAYGIDIKTIPLVMQFNKRDLPNAVSVDELNGELNRLNVPWYEAQAANGIGVFETLRGVSKLLLAKISKEVLEKDGRAIASVARPAAAALSREAAPAEAPVDAKTGKQSVGGKLLKYLKRGKGIQPEETPEPAAAQAPSAPERVDEPTPFLSDDALIEDSPAPFFSDDASIEDSSAPLLSDDALLDEPSAPRPGEPRPLNAEEELVLSETDLVDRAPASLVEAPQISDEEVIGDFERETTMFDVTVPRREPARVPEEAATGDTRRISIPLDLGALPQSGTITLTFEIQIRVQSDEPAKPAKPAKKEKKTAGLDDSYIREIEAIP